MTNPGVEKQTAGSQSSVLKTKFTKPLSKGCGFISLFFFAFFVWGVYSMFSSKSEEVQVTGTVVAYSEQEAIGPSSKMVIYFSPIVNYSFEGVDYTVTLLTTDLAPEYPVKSSIALFVDPDYPEHASDDDSISSSFMYLPFLILAIISFMAYRYLKGFQINLKDSEMGRAILQTKSGAVPAKEASDPVVEIQVDGSDIDKTKPKEGTAKSAIIIGLIVLSIGGGLGYSAYLDYARGARLEKSDVTVVGQIIGEQRNHTSSGSHTNKELRRFTIAYSYKEVDYQYETRDSLNEYNPGDKVELKVNPDDPEEAAINYVTELYGNSNIKWFALLFLVIGVLITYGGITMALKKKNT
ncbi:MAG: DUF3592 domain-containing protein [Gammaproteobacteria bacterium]|nr:DUF3592 domain-containing protein [Gammaproteobacteria bacterium]